MNKTMSPLVLLSGLMVTAVLLGAVFVLSGMKDKPHIVPSEFVSVKGPQGQLLVARYETSVEQWRACQESGACPALVGDMDADVMPMVGLKWADIKAYLDWYQVNTGDRVRLPTQEEWALLAADHLHVERKLFDDPRMAWAASYDMSRGPEDAVRKHIGAFGGNGLGLYDVRGNVWEWTSTCEPQVREINGAAEPCFAGRVAMGKHRSVLSDQRRDPGKAGCSTGQPPDHVGFRIVKEAKA